MGALLSTAGKGGPDIPALWCEDSVALRGVIMFPLSSSASWPKSSLKEAAPNFSFDIIWCGGFVRSLSLASVCPQWEKNWSEAEILR